MTTEETKPAESIAKHTEFETKYRVEPSVLTEFKRIVDTLPGLKKFIYVEGPDEYYTNEHVTKQLEAHTGSFRNSKDAEDYLRTLNDTIGSLPPFLRFRRPSHGLDGNRQELTTKYKQDGAKNNIQREEKNLRVDNTGAETVKQFIKDFGYKLNFSIWKTCHIYNFDDATLVFYSVYDTTNGKASKMDNFVEIEISEEKVEEGVLTEDMAWETVAKYEKALESIGVTARSRLRKSLFEMYRREVK